MARRKRRNLKTRRRRGRKPSGRAVRLSNFLLNYIEPRIQGARSYDAYFRRVLGLETWQGDDQSLVEGYLVPGEGRHGVFVLKTAGWAQARQQAYEISISQTARRNVRTGKKYVPPRPLRMREIA